MQISLIFHALQSSYERAMCQLDDKFYTSDTGIHFSWTLV